MDYAQKMIFLKYQGASYLAQIQKTTKNKFDEREANKNKTPWKTLAWVLGNVECVKWGYIFLQSIRSIRSNFVHHLYIDNVFLQCTT